MRLRDVAAVRRGAQGARGDHAGQRPGVGGDRPLQGGRRQHRHRRARCCASGWPSWQQKLPAGRRSSRSSSTSREFIEQALRRGARLGAARRPARDPRAASPSCATCAARSSSPSRSRSRSSPTFVLMYRLDISLNIMSLGGLTLGHRHAGGQLDRRAGVDLPASARRASAWCAPRSTAPTRWARRSSPRP